MINVLHKYAVNLLALLTLCLALFSFFGPNIESYNSEIKEKQIELRVQANGSPDSVYKFDADWGGRMWHPTYYAEIAFSLILFFSLVLSQRILFSLLFAFLFIFQFIILYRIYSSTVDYPDSYFRNYSLFSPVFVSCAVALSYWVSSIIYRFFSQMFQSKHHL